jgi:hypothetical protein
LLVDAVEESVEQVGAVALVVVGGVVAPSQQAATDLPAPAIPEIDTRLIAGYDAKLDRFRAALEAGADPAVVAAWIATPR